MKLDDILQDSILESITFSPVDIKKQMLDGKEQDVITGRYKKEEIDCWECEQREKFLPDDIDHLPELKRKRDNARKSCPYCNGTGKEIREVAMTPELNLSNANAYFLMKMLDVEQDYAGLIRKEEIPEIKRKVLKWKNASERGVKEPSESRGKFGERTDSETGLTKISHGATMYDAGRSNEYIESLIDRFMEILDYAQKNDMHVGWS